MLSFEKFQAGLNYADFLARYGSDAHRTRWQGTFDAVLLTPAQTETLSAFTRTVNVLCLAGAWCGDCAAQCPIFQKFALITPRIDLRFIDRDEHPDAQQELKVNGGDRVPVVVFFSEDGFEVGRYGDRTLTRYRQMLKDQLGEACATGIAPKNGDPLLAGVVQDWLDEFERAHAILRLSPRLRRLHGD